MLVYSLHSLHQRLIDSGFLKGRYNKYSLDQEQADGYHLPRWLVGFFRVRTELTVNRQAAVCRRLW